ncbi:hypothetical protein MRX96_051201 [Rhipicephalus microplus]
MAKMPKSSTKLSPIKATASPAAQGIVRTSSCDRGTAPKDDARARAASPEARKMAAGALSSTAGSRPGSQPIDIGLYRPMLSTERDPPTSQTDAFEYSNGDERKASIFRTQYYKHESYCRPGKRYQLWRPVFAFKRLPVTCALYLAWNGRDYHG